MSSARQKVAPARQYRDAANDPRGGVPMMSTREVAKLTGKAHQDVLRDARNMLTQLDMDASSFAGVYTGGQRAVRHWGATGSAAGRGLSETPLRPGAVVTQVP